ncbi:hypothetical protein EMIHUDRAFT_251221 [Emiliania huxleyi CCMP1516]|uniref:U-box domain-containing protein n=2 Tax=Emiliania huxleyi TaxID=2903 RepID=A0A0D3KWX7_EMIH1|nr:hypothetical protein EMIHUDRAFT_251221 [Emiliania huxleyi CCMP1516]EOD40262.1 hypothetical protein EMIHUDRAFT_251221 [Emiliania huxleyi CCMP1516]|eukprot:XP_005792691.1 hypothetical protein EMIHUDRAFT_251221 [Emiliania huxleyi CCMP1516]
MAGAAPIHGARSLSAELAEKRAEREALEARLATEEELARTLHGMSLETLTIPNTASVMPSPPSPPPPPNEGEAFVDDHLYALTNIPGFESIMLPSNPECYPYDGDANPRHPVWDHQSLHSVIESWATTQFRVGSTRTVGLAAVHNALRCCLLSMPESERAKLLGYGAGAPPPTLPDSAPLEPDRCRLLELPHDMLVLIGASLVDGALRHKFGMAHRMLRATMRSTEALRPTLIVPMLLLTIVTLLMSLLLSTKMVLLLMVILQKKAALVRHLHSYDYFLDAHHLVVAFAAIASSPSDLRLSGAFQLASEGPVWRFGRLERLELESGETRLAALAGEQVVHVLPAEIASLHSLRHLGLSFAIRDASALSVGPAGLTSLSVGSSVLQELPELAATGLQRLDLSSAMQLTATSCSSAWSVISGLRHLRELQIFYQHWPNLPAHAAANRHYPEWLACALRGSERVVEASTTSPVFVQRTGLGVKIINSARRMRGPELATRLTAIFLLRILQHYRWHWAEDSEERNAAGAVA